ncbi:MAG: DUF6316 family protein [Kangiellaceae bacterium]|nr:DUF6316 family protein [Kangiellaceae bacterium]
MAENLSLYTCRNGETTTRQFIRSGRFFQNSGHWFFKTREGVDYGPFNSRTECRYAYNEFIEIVSNQSDLSTMPLDYNDSETDWEIPNIKFN